MINFSYPTVNLGLKCLLDVREMCELGLVLHVLNELSYPVVGAPVGQLRQVVHLNTYQVHENDEIRVAKSSHNPNPEFSQQILGRIQIPCVRLLSHF